MNKKKLTFCYTAIQLDHQLQNNLRTYPSIILYLEVTTNFSTGEIHSLIFVCRSVKSSWSSSINSSNEFADVLK